MNDRTSCPDCGAAPRISADDGRVLTWACGNSPKPIGQVQTTTCRLNETQTKLLASEAELARAREQLGKVRGELTIEKANASRLAYRVAQAIMLGWIRARSALSDELENYLEIGGLDGPSTVPEWIESYEAAQAGGDHA